MPGNKKRKSYGDVDEVMDENDTECCGVSFLRNFIYIFNFIFFLSGISMLCVTGWLFFFNMRFVTIFLSPIYSSIMYLSLSCALFIIFFFTTGCVGARLPKSSCLGCFATCLLLVFLMQISIGVLAYCYQFMVSKELLGSLNKAIAKGYAVDAATTSAVDQMQQQLKCCGSTSYEDWKMNKWLRDNITTSSSPTPTSSKSRSAALKNIGDDEKEVKRVPDSCCITMVAGCGLRIHPSNINTDGCTRGLELVVLDELNLVGSMALGFSILQIFGMIFSCCLVKKLQTWKTEDGKMMLL
ncbi:hypothetical protein HELRODRAFT_185683 [Helobdella robusta]|uniref:Tetraspanin n=1 Tax=Helobdella robusta TaxID=6412 RepID=T1FN52_HELRO|nr:hypothetical protein HELRODRAFT_185683 [Helobdella robusta]ESO01490.1 hypothetical protein HELRODRAFT_185683 [Helobdella robusta]